MCSWVRPQQSLTLTLLLPNRDMKFWHGLVIAAVSLILQTCLLAAVNYLLSRHMGK